MIAQLLKSLLKQKSAVEKRSFQNTNTALERARNEFNNDNKQDTLDKKYGRITEDAKDEYLTPRLMEKYDVDRAHAMSKLENHHGDMDKAGKVWYGACRVSKRRLNIDPVIPTRDTQSPPNVTPQTQIISVLGVDKYVVTSNVASPVLGGGWMVSDFYLWMHVLHSMGNGQEWITSITPGYLLEKYERKDEVTMHSVDPDEPSTMKTCKAKGHLKLFMAIRSRLER